MIEEQRQLLIKLRSELVGKKHTLPYTIYTDNTIEELLKAQPKTLEQLSKVKGFPKEGKRLKGFGEAIVSIFTKNVKSFSFKVENGNPVVETTLKQMKLF